MNKHWLSPVLPLMKAGTGNLRELAILVGADPSVFYRGANLTNADLRGQDLRGMDFSGASLAGAILDGQTLLDRQYDFRISETNKRRRYLSIPFSLMPVIVTHQINGNFRSAGWAIRDLLDIGARTVTDYKRHEAWYDMISNSEQLTDLFFADESVRARFVLMISDDTYEKLHESRPYTTRSGQAIFGIIVGALSRSGLGPEDIYSVDDIVEALGGEPASGFGRFRGRSI